MKIGILTQPLYNNYGGLLQAYALQKVFADAGHEVWIINRVSKERSFLYECAAFGKRFIFKCLLKRNNQLLFIFKPTKEENKIVAQNTSLFIQKQFPRITNKITTSKEMVRLKKEYSFDAYVVGSDQVWRPAYSPCITNYFLDFAEREREREIKRIAYAASFGVDKWEFTNKQTKECVRLAKIFDAISVREDSGVNLCRKYLGVDAVHVLDPTMLLDKGDYIDLTKEEKSAAGDLMTYILDMTDKKQQLINTVSAKLNLTPFSVMPNKILTKKTRSQIHECIYPPVTKWLRGFIDAKFVITDSFHGCIFSILFNKPFIAIGNPERGMSRFISLLKMFALEDRLVCGDEINKIDLFTRKIDWQIVNSRIRKRREESKSFLAGYI